MIVVRRHRMRNPRSDYTRTKFKSPPITKEEHKRWVTDTSIVVKQLEVLGISEFLPAEVAHHKKTLQQLIDERNWPIALVFLAGIPVETLNNFSNANGCPQLVSDRLTQLEQLISCARISILELRSKVRARSPVLKLFGYVA